MNRVTKLAMLCGGAAVLFVAGAAVARSAAPDPGKANLPSGWNYEIKNGKRVPKAERKTNADGSWTEVTQTGNCTETKSRSAAGEIKVTRSCD